MIAMLQAGGVRSVSLGTILGYAMAHEIGHLLLNTAGHSCRGVMKARWTAGDLAKMPSYYVNFDLDQVAKIGNEVRRRNQDLQSKSTTPLPRAKTVCMTPQTMVPANEKIF